VVSVKVIATCVWVCVVVAIVMVATFTVRVAD